MTDIWGLWYAMGAQSKDGATENGYSPSSQA